MHDPLSSILHSNFSILGTQLFFSRIEVQCTKSIIHCDTFDACQTMVSIIYFFHWFFLTTQWISNAYNACVVFYMLNLLPIVIYFYSLNFYWSILILSGSILKVIHMYTMFYCSLYMTLNYFKYLFIFKEMKCKTWDITFVKYFKMWLPFFNQQYHLLELTYAFFTVIFSLDILFKDSKHTILLL